MAMNHARRETLEYLHVYRDRCICYVCDVLYFFFNLKVVVCVYAYTVHDGSGNTSMAMDRHRPETL